MLPRALSLALLLACANAETSQEDFNQPLTYRDFKRSIEGTSDRCHYQGRYFSDGDSVVTNEACLRCRCGRGAISCRRRTCAPLPEPPPPRCHLIHRRDSCCPELHCQDGTISVERAFGGFDEEYPETAIAPNHVFPVCVDGGTAYSAGSAMSSSTACEQCFCLGGVKRCVRPKCLPPPPGCKARPSPGACCPQKYYCNHATTKPPGERHVHDCKIDGKWITEGERVLPQDDKVNCSQCFCIFGAVHCQALSCAPPLMGCKPILEQGQCCPHQYQCDHQQRRGLPGFHLQPIIDNALISIRNQDRSFRNVPSNENKTTTLAVTSTATEKTTASATTIKKESTTTIKVKRKTDDPPLTSSSRKTEANITSSTSMASTTQTTSLVADGTTEETLEDDVTQQPDGSIKIVINGTINCTAELSSTAIKMNATSAENTKEFTKVVNIQPRIPNIGLTIESHTYNPNDIITDRNFGEDFDDNESYTINVTSSLISSLRTNVSMPTTSVSSTTAAKPSFTEEFGSLNISKKTKDDYDYNSYEKPTLPPSLPNLKIIPFVAADAVVDDEISSKESFTYPLLERDDKYPVYYPSVEAKETLFATRREDLYNPTQYPIYLSKKVEPSQYPHEIDLTNEYPTNGDIITSLQDYTVTTSVGSSIPQTNKAVTKFSNHNVSKLEVQTPTVNLFSPPMETEGGFIPKDPGMIDDYYPIYPTTPAGSMVPHLTTSMQLDSTKGECLDGDGKIVLEGESVGLACSICTCAWGNLHCSQRPCHVPPGCRRSPASTSLADPCCGDLICDNENTKKSSSGTQSLENVNATLISNKNNMMNDTKPLPQFSTPENVTLQAETATESNNKTAEQEERYNKKELSTTERTTPSVTTAAIEDRDSNNSNSQEDDDEEDDEEGFSFGSVLKLLLSDSYESTTAAGPKRTNIPVTNRAPTVMFTQTTTIKSQPLKPSSTPSPDIFQPFRPLNNPQVQNSISRIDHLVLGEATAIKKTTTPTTIPFKPIITRKPLPIKKPATQRPTTTLKPVEVTKKTDLGQYTSTSESLRPSSFNNIGSLGAGLLKLAGCNIYGQMYRVGRIIAELSTPCQECRCTELGVQCRQLNC